MSEPDPIELEVFRHLFASVAEEMGERLMRSAYSPNIKERRDFSCALFDAHGEMLAQAAHIPVHLGSTPMAVRAVIDAFHLSEKGDKYILNKRDLSCSVETPSSRLSEHRSWHGGCSFVGHEYDQQIAVSGRHARL